MVFARCDSTQSQESTFQKDSRMDGGIDDLNLMSSYTLLKSQIDIIIIVIITWPK